MIRGSKIFLMLLLTVGLVFSTAAVASADRGTLIFGLEGKVIKLDPGSIVDKPSISVMANMFEGLVEFEPGTVRLRPCLAKSWEVSEDGKEITFHLRRGVKFHDGTDFNADAVVFAFARQYDPNHWYHKYAEWAAWKRASDMEKVVKIDDYTVKVVLKKKSPAMLSILALYYTWIPSPTNAKKYKEDTFKHPCGTGPFKFVEWVKADHLTLEANKNYWRGRPKLDRVIYRPIPDSSARLMALEVNQIQGMGTPNPADYNRIKANPDLQLLTQVGCNIGWMCMNCGYGYKDANQNRVRDPEEPWIKTLGYLEPLTKKKVRQAINCAIDKKAIVDSIYKGTAVVAKSSYPPSMLGYNDEIEDYPYDPQRAKELLKEAGYPDGFEVTLTFHSRPRPSMIDPPKIAEAIQAYLAAVGITVNLRQLDYATYLSDVMQGKHNMLLKGWASGNGDPDNYSKALLASNACPIGAAGNRAFYHNEEMQKLIDLGGETYDTTKRAEFYKKVDEILHEDAPRVILANGKQSFVFRSNVHGFVIDFSGYGFFYPVWIE